MEKVEKRLSKIIYEWVKKNFGESEADDPSWSIEALAHELAEHNTELFWMVEKEYIKEDVEQEAEDMNVELTDEQVSQVAEEYINSESYGEIDHDALEYFINKAKQGE